MSEEGEKTSAYQRKVKWSQAFVLFHIYLLSVSEDWILG